MPLDICEMIIAGFGGQGILFAGKVLAHSALCAGYQVSWLPSYGPEMRGGAAHCHVILSREEIFSPLSIHPHVLMALSEPALEKFESSVRPGGVIVMDSSLITKKVSRSDVKTIYYPATQIAKDIGGQKGATLSNMLLLGKTIRETNLLPLSKLNCGIEKSVPTSKKSLITFNKQAVKIGYDG